jgi:hypothetical protein
MTSIQETRILKDLCNVGSSQELTGAHSNAPESSLVLPSMPTKGRFQAIGFYQIYKPIALLVPYLFMRCFQSPTNSSYNQPG